MRILEDGQEVEKVNLQEIQTKEALHQMMLDKGFVKKPEVEIRALQEERRAAKEERNKSKMSVIWETRRQKREQQARHRAEIKKERDILGPEAPSYVIQYYVGAGVALLAFVSIRRKRRRR